MHFIDNQNLLEGGMLSYAYTLQFCGGVFAIDPATMTLVLKICFHVPWDILTLPALFLEYCVHCFVLLI